MASEGGGFQDPALRDIYMDLFDKSTLQVLVSLDGQGSRRGRRSPSRTREGKPFILTACHLFEKHSTTCPNLTIGSKLIPAVMNAGIAVIPGPTST